MGIETAGMSEKMMLSPELGKLSNCVLNAEFGVLQFTCGSPTNGQIRARGGGIGGPSPLARICRSACRDAKPAYIMSSITETENSSIHLFNCACCLQSRYRTRTFVPSHFQPYTLIPYVPNLPSRVAPHPMHVSSILHSN